MEITAPDYTTAQWQPIRDAMKASVPGMTDEVAAGALKAAWDAKRAMDEADRIVREAAEEERIRAEEAEENERRAAEKKAREDERRAEEAKNRQKYAPISEGIDDSVLYDFILATPVKKVMKTGAWVGMWHMSDEGIAAAAKDADEYDDGEVITLKKSRKDDEFVLKGNSISVTGQVSDENMAFADLTVAFQRFPIAARQSGWREDRIAMFVGFFKKIVDHPWRVENDPLKVKERALILYAARRRKLWHANMDSYERGPLPDIRVWRAKLMEDCRSDAYDLMRSRRDKAWQDKILAESARVSRR